MDLLSEYATVQEVLVFFATLSITYIVVNGFTPQSKLNGKKLPPSIGSFPVIGSMPYLPNLRNMHHWSLDKSYKLGGVFSFQFGNQYTVLLNSHEAIREAFVQRSVQYADRAYLKSFSNPLFNPKGKGFIIHTYDEEFKKYHQMSLSILKQFGFGKNIMETRILIEVGELINALRGMNGQTFDPREKLTHAVQSIISRIVFGLPIDPTNNADKRLMELVLKWGDQFMNLFPLDHLPSLRFLPPFRKFVRDTETETNEMFEVSINQKINQCLRPDAEESFVSNFVEKEGKGFDRGQLKVTIRDLIFAGTDTVSSTLMWTCIFLAKNPTVQQRLQKEIDFVVPRDRHPSLDDMSKMNYVEATVLELMRIRTVLPIGVARATLCNTEVCGYFIPKNTNVYSMLHSVHMDVNVWKDPEVFRPDRFFDSAGNMINKDLVIPFGIGKRSCLGESMARQEVFLFLTGLVQQFNILPPEGCQKIEEDKEHSHGVISPNPFQVRFLLRN